MHLWKVRLINQAYELTWAATFILALTNIIQPRGNGVLESVLACCAGDLGLIPAVGVSNKECAIFRWIFLPLCIRWKDIKEESLAKQMSQQRVFQ